MTTRTQRKTGQAKRPTTMIAVRWYGGGFSGIRVERVPVPRPGPRQLLARVDAAGVCASNLKLLAQGPNHVFLNGWDPTRYPLQLGDEGCITLVEVGTDLRKRFCKGERYCLQPAVDHAPLRHRERYRRRGHGMTKCAIGYTLPGHLAQYLLVTEEAIEAQCVVPLPSGEFPYYAAALCEPISCVISAQQRHVHLEQDTPLMPRLPRLGLKRRGVVAVVGAGPMGRIHAEAALRFRPRALVVSDRSQERLDWIRSTLGVRARELGACLRTVLPGEMPNALRAVSGGAGADDIIVAVGDPQVLFEAQQWLARGGVLNLFGGLKHGEHVIGLDTLRVHYDEIRVVGSSGGSPADMAETLRMVASGEIAPALHLGMVGSLDQFPRALDMVKEAKTEGKIVLYPHVTPTPLTPAAGWNAAVEARFLRERRS